ncbi:MAG: ABC transporter substrate-binding protein [Rhodopseudomonas palustris]|uniref:Thiamine pyrimidine synthase n=1 Tax=Rhodopseudomonas palustris TaxID=1076 RepID=A0A933RUG5_RHOPL|nr:ABC transporter substrate-binding protein [Rhodopseudomonas palustris]
MGETRSSRRRRSSPGPRRGARLRLRLLGAALLGVLAVVAVAALLLRPEPVPVAGQGAESGAAGRGGAAPLAMLIDGAYGARFAGEMAAFRNGYFPPGTTLQADPGDADFVAKVARQNAVGVTSAVKFLEAAWRGVPVVAFAGSLLDTPVRVFAPAAADLRRPEDLVGKRIGYRTGDADGVMVVDAMFAQLGLPRSRITLVPLEDPFAALQAGTVDAVISEAGRQPLPPARPISSPSPIIPPLHLPPQTYFASAALVRERPQAILGMLEALIKGWRFVYADETRSVPMLTGFDPGRLAPDRVAFELQQQRSLVLPTGGRIGEYDESRWRTLRDILLFAKRGEETVPLAQIVNYQFLREAYRQNPDGGRSGRTED